MQLQFVKTHEDAKLPQKNNPELAIGDAGFDVFSVEEVVVPDEPEVENQYEGQAVLDKELTPIKDEPVVQKETAPEVEDLPEKYKGKQRIIIRISAEVVYIANLLIP